VIDNVALRLNRHDIILGVSDDAIRLVTAREHSLFLKFRERFLTVAAL
jgi:hypothetical protein